MFQFGPEQVGGGGLGWSGVGNESNGERKREGERGEREMERERV